MVPVPIKYSYSLSLSLSLSWLWETTNLKKFQVVSGLMLGSYVVMHIFNHYILNVNYKQANFTMMSLHKVYCWPLFQIWFTSSLILMPIPSFIQNKARSKPELNIGRIFGAQSSLHCYTCCLSWFWSTALPLVSCLFFILKIWVPLTIPLR